MGYPGEGPGDRGRVATPSSASAPVTPPKTPPKAANPDLAPPWNEDLEVEVRGVVGSYLQGAAKGSGVVVTESRRILVPPPKTSKNAGPAPHNRTRQPPEPPVPRAKAKVSNPEMSRVITVGPKAGTVRPTPPPPPKARRAPQEQNRVVKPKFDTGFCYPVSPKTEEVPTNSPSFSGIRLSLQDNLNLPGIRPSMPLNLDRRLPIEEVIDGSRVAKRQSEALVTGESTTASKPRFARPTPKVKRPQDIPSESTGNPPQGKGGFETLPKSEPSPVSGHESIGRPVSSGPVKKRGEQDTADVRPDPNHVEDRASSSVELTSSSSELEVRLIGEDAEKGLPVRGGALESSRPEPAALRNPEPVREIIGDKSDASLPPASYTGEGIGLGDPCLSMGSADASSHRPTDDPTSQPPEGDQSSVMSEQDFQVELEVCADPTSADSRLLQMTGAYHDSIRVHGTRRVLEALLVVWRPGYYLAGLARYLRGGDGSVLEVDISTREPFARLIIGSRITATFSKDPNGHRAIINQSLIRSMLKESQMSDAACNRCDPTRPARIFVQDSELTSAVIMTLRMQLRAFPPGTLCSEVLAELQLAQHSAVGLCRTFSHWIRIPRQFRLQPNWGLILWPVPRSD